MELIHTLLFFIRENRREEDLGMAAECLKSLEKSTYKTVVIYNQGCLTNEGLKEYLAGFGLDFHITGEGVNAGTTVGRQSCFNYIWENFPDTVYISELHLDMIFTYNWEDALVNYLDGSGEGLISCGIVDQKGFLPFLDKAVAVPCSKDLFDDFLKSLSVDVIKHGFTNPCIHVSKILKETGGYDPLFLTGKQCFEDDSMLLGYYYYYGTKQNWHPKVNFNSVVYHAVAGQRLSLNDSIAVNFNGLVKQYGAMGLKHLSALHKSAWQKNYFSQQYGKITGR
jgi:hypothetical protein